jgi:hypothetical protein
VSTSFSARMAVMIPKQVQNVYAVLFAGFTLLKMNSMDGREQ